MNFQTNSAYELIPDGEPYIFGDIALPTKELPVGSKLYRADARGKRKPSGNYPEFVGNYKFVRNSYTRANKPLSEQVSTFTVKKPLRLLLWNYESIQALRKHPVANTNANQKVLDHYLQQYEGVNESEYVTPLGYLEGNDENTAKHKYINRLMVDMICYMGLDGWVVLPNTLKWYIWGRVEDYAPEIVLCSPLYARVNYSGGTRRSRRFRKKLNTRNRHF